MKKGYCNGYKPKRVKSPEDKLTLQIPQTRDSKEEFRD